MFSSDNAAEQGWGWSMRRVITAPSRNQRRLFDYHLLYPGFSPVYRSSHLWICQHFKNSRCPFSERQFPQLEKQPGQSERLRVTPEHKKSEGFESWKSLPLRKWRQNSPWSSIVIVGKNWKKACIMKTDRSNKHRSRSVLTVERVMSHDLHDVLIINQDRFQNLTKLFCCLNRTKLQLFHNINDLLRKYLNLQCRTSVSPFWQREYLHNTVDTCLWSIGHQI